MNVENQLCISNFTIWKWFLNSENNFQIKSLRILLFENQM